MATIQVTLEFDEKDLGEKWMNPDNLELLLYGKDFTTRELLQVVAYQEIKPDPESQPLDARVMQTKAGVNTKHNYFKRFYMAYNKYIKDNVASNYNYPTLWSKIIACHRFTKLNWDC